MIRNGRSYLLANLMHIFIGIYRGGGGGVIGDYLARYCGRKELAGLIMFIMSIFAAWTLSQYYLHL